MSDVLAILDLYGLFVELVFGGVFLSLIGLIIIYAIMMAMGKLSISTVLLVEFSFVFVAGCLFSQITFATCMLLGLIYIMFSIVRFFSGGLN